MCLKKWINQFDFSIRSYKYDLLFRSSVHSLANVVLLNNDSLGNSGSLLRFKQLNGNKPISYQDNNDEVLIYV